MKSCFQLHKLPTEIHAIILCLQDMERPLKGVIIYVSKKLSGQQAELNDLVAELGGDYKWQYDATCTHFIFQVRRQSDVNQIFVTLRNSDSGCKKASIRIPELGDKAIQCRTGFSFAQCIIHHVSLLV